MRNAEYFGLIGSWPKANTPHPYRAGRLAQAGPFSPVTTQPMDEPNQEEPTATNFFFTTGKRKKKNLPGHIRRSIAKQSNLRHEHTLQSRTQSTRVTARFCSARLLLRGVIPSNASRALAPPSVFVRSNAVAPRTGARGGACLPCLRSAPYPPRPLSRALLDLVPQASGAPLPGAAWPRRRAMLVSAAVGFCPPEATRGCGRG